MLRRSGSRPATQEETEGAEAWLQRKHLEALQLLSTLPPPGARARFRLVFGLDAGPPPTGVVMSANHKRAVAREIRQWAFDRTPTMRYPTATAPFEVPLAARLAEAARLANWVLSGQLPLFGQQGQDSAIRGDSLQRADAAHASGDLAGLDQGGSQLGGDEWAQCFGRALVGRDGHETNSAGVGETASVAEGGESSAVGSLPEWLRGATILLAPGTQVVSAETMTLPEGCRLVGYGGWGDAVR